MDLAAIPTIRDLPWAHKGNGVIVNAKKRTLGAFESSHDAEAVVAIVNALSLPQEHTHER